MKPENDVQFSQWFLFTTCFVYTWYSFSNWWWLLVNIWYLFSNLVL